MKKYPPFFYVLVPLASVIFIFFLLEILFRLLSPAPFFIGDSRFGMYYESDPYLGYKIKANSVGAFWDGTIPAIANSHGQRNKEVEKNKKDRFRIMVLGDSFTVGRNVRELDAYPQVLEALINSSSEKKFEVINAGVDGWSPFQYAQYLQYYGKDFKPDLVIVGFFVGNDTYDQTSRVDQLNKTALAGIMIRKRNKPREDYSINTLIFLTKIIVYKHSHLFRFFMNRTRAIKIPEKEMNDWIRDDCADFTEGFLATQKNRLTNHLINNEKTEGKISNAVHQIERIQEIAKQISAKLLVVLLPDENQINPILQNMIVSSDTKKLYDFKMPQKILKQQFELNNIEVLDLLPTFLEDGRCLYMNDTHFTPQGHELVAREIYNKIKK